MIDILIPTMDNRSYLQGCIDSIVRETRGVDYRILVINNGRDYELEWCKGPKVDVWEGHGNHGWTGGLYYGVQETNGDAVLFMNDDTIIPPHMGEWLALLSSHLADPLVGAVGPATNLAIGAQGQADTHAPLVSVAPFLVGFCMLVRRKALDDAGGVDPSLPGGDDIDLSIRLRRKLYTLVVDRRAFVYHFGFVTGTRVYGPAHMPGGWNSREYSTAVWEALERKHGIEGLRLVGWGA